ncbi:MAG: Glyoxalase/bleomycin resistance protein [uncultured bacterium]|nr:MAG: Glyoxalase/bleomycin resistance protein [uncultured bacterium]
MKVIHFEIPAEDPMKLVDFYSKVFGWKISQWEKEQYWIADAGPKEEKGIGGAIYKKSAEMDKLINTISVPVLEEAIDMVKESGGTIVGEIKDIPHVGRNIMAHDPEGNLFGMLEISEEMKNM